MSEHSGRVSQIRFEVDGYSSYFRIERDDRSGVLPDWSQELVSATEHVPGSNRSITQMSGFGLASLTLALWLDDRDGYVFFRKLLGSTGTLVLLANFTSHEGELRHELGRDYEYFADTTLMQIGRAEHHIGGYVRCEATFVRAFDPVTNTAVLP